MCHSVTFLQFRKHAEKRLNSVFLAVKVTSRARNLLCSASGGGNMSDFVASVRRTDSGRAGVSGEPNGVELPAKSAIAARVMVIDGSPDIVSVLSRFLKNEGCVSIEAHSGIEGLSLLADNDVDLIFLDPMMPEMDGFEVFQALKSGSRNAEGSVIMMTARNDYEARLRAQRLGIEEFLSKPVFRSQLTQKLRAQLHLEPAEHYVPDGQRNSLGSYVSICTIGHGARTGRIASCVRDFC